MYDAKPGSAVVEHAVAGGGPADHGGSSVREIRPLNKHGLIISGRGGRDQLSTRECLFQIAVQRQLDWHIPIRCAADARPPASVVRVDAEGVDHAISIAFAPE